MAAIPPALVVDVLLALIVSHLCYALLPYRRRSYPFVLLLAGAGLALGQGWNAFDLPAVRLGDAAVIPGVLFAVLLQPLAGRLPAIVPRFSEPRVSAADSEGNQAGGDH